MDFRNQAVRNENLLSHPGIGLKSDLANPAKSAKKPLGKVGDISNLTNSKVPKKIARKPLGDVSNFRKPQSSSNLGEISKSKPLENANRSTQKKNKNSILTDEELKQCEEWAKDGIEYMGFTGTDQINLEEQQMEERVKQGVRMAMSGVHEWGNDIFDLVLRPKDEDDDIEVKWESELEFSPKKLKPGFDHFESDMEDLDAFDDEWLFAPAEFTLKEEFDI